MTNAENGEIIQSNFYEYWANLSEIAIAEEILLSEKNIALIIQKVIEGMDLNQQNKRKLGIE